MISIVSPAKSLDFDSKAPTANHTQAVFLDKSQKIVDELIGYTPNDISKLMNISNDLGILNADRYQKWTRPFDLNNAKQAIFAFTGDVYKGLDAHSLSNEVLEYAQAHLKIISGLYGMLKPLDLIQPYRLEMGIKICIDDKRSLYEYWTSILTEELNKEINVTESKYLLNLASNEYSKSINLKDLNAEVITPVFKDWKNGDYKIISFYAKRARGLMSRYILENQINDAEDLKGFQSDGYIFNEELSNSQSYMYTRRL